MWVIATYLSPSLTPSQVTVTLKEIVQLINTEGHHYVVGGDFNMEWNHLQTTLENMGINQNIVRKSTGKTRVSFTGVNSNSS